MSITRLQQARQMYAMGQRVAKTLDGSRPGYRGDDAARSSEGTSAGRADPGAGAGYGDGPSSSDRDTNTREDNNPFNTAPPQTTTNLDVKEQYGIGNPITLGAPIAPPTVSPFLEESRYNNYIDSLNLGGYRPESKIPPFIPGATAINFIGNLGSKYNRDFFAKNVAGKFGYGYGIDSYNKYMEQRMAGNVNAYGNSAGMQNLDDSNNDGILQLYDSNNDFQDDGSDDGSDDNNTTNNVNLRYTGLDNTIDPTAAGVANTDQLRALMLERAQNMYTT